MIAPLLIFAYGNPSRGDDALGPLLLERLQALNLAHVETLTDFQLQVEHAYDLQGREQVLFIDASISCVAPYAFSRLAAQKDTSYTTHVMSPMAVLHVYRELYGDPPPAYLLQVRGECFELGAALSPAAVVNLQAAFDLLQRLCAVSDLREWEQLALPH
ncbi:MAG: hydrogenase maturation protease [Pseudomonadota bacterium]